LFFCIDIVPLLLLFQVLIYSLFEWNQLMKKSLMKSPLWDLD